MKLRLLIALPLAALVTTALFLFMQYLIHAPSTALQTTEISGVVELYQPPEPPERQRQQPEQPTEEQSSHQEPSMEALTVEAVERICLETLGHLSRCTPRETVHAVSR